MGEKNTPRKPRTRTNYVCVLGGGYLVYLAWRLFSDVRSGKPDGAAVGIVAGVAFAIIGGWLLWQEWKVYRYAQAHKDDPETWALEETEEEEP